MTRSGNHRICGVLRWHLRMDDRLVCNSLVHWVLFKSKAPGVKAASSFRIRQASPTGQHKARMTPVSGGVLCTVLIQCLTFTSCSCSLPFDHGSPQGVAMCLPDGWSYSLSSRARPRPADNVHSMQQKSLVTCGILAVAFCFICYMYAADIAVILITVS